MTAIVLALIEAHDRYLLIQESKPQVRGTWNLPGGHVEPGETLADALAREVREEAGIDCSLEGLMYMDHAARGPGRDGRFRFVFRATARSEGLKCEPDEHSERALWIERGELRQLNLRNSLVSAMVELATSRSPILPMGAVQSREWPVHA